MFAKFILAALVAIVALFGCGESQYVYPAAAAAALPAYYPSYYGAAYYGYAAPAYYAWGSNKGAAPAPRQAPVKPTLTTDN
ncbi:unnamed protein product [Caenorhabditis bovis]|uniref:Uncharacterized protein n=1 Tax=Caenorhabditis bovis TaxID=2654633 RepID=A0A8S1E7S1_9PELO|nr:unnamed protein product [Caenorhabditis bovis]